MRSINPKAVVALFCHGKEKDDVWKGTGNIISSKGYILTNRHVAAKAEYCEVAVPGDSIRLETRDEIADLSATHSVTDISGWRPYKATNVFVPSQEGLSDEEKDALDFAIMKIDAINDGCELFGECPSLPTSFPFNKVSNFFMPTSTAGLAFPITLDTAKFNIPIRPYEMLMYGYPSTGSGVGGGHVLRNNLGYAIAYLPGNKKFDGQPIIMIQRMLHGTYGGSSGSGVYYNGHIVGLAYAAFTELKAVQTVIPMPFISLVLKENGKQWLLDP